MRELAQSGLHPANCRLLDASEAELTGAGSGESDLLILGFESAGHPVEAAMAMALEIAREHGGRPGEVRGGGGEGGDAVGAWRGAFLLAPVPARHLRRLRGALGDLRDGDHLGPLRGVPRERDGGGAERGGRGERAPAEGAGAPRISCRLTHVYPDGAAPYFTVLAPAVRGGEVEQWDEIKAAVSEALIAGGGTITHHHAVGRDHRPWYDRQRPAPFAAALRAAKAELDPAGGPQSRRPDRPLRGRPPSPRGCGSPL